MPKLTSDLIKYLRMRYVCFQEERLERRFRIETAMPESEYLQLVESPNKAYAVPYEPIQLNRFNEMILALERHISHLRGYHFIDLGSGKGRALIYASEAGFEQCTGIEFSVDLHEKALSNIASYKSNSSRKCTFSLYCMDAADFAFPNSDIVLYMYNPFRIEVMTLVLRNIDEFTASNRNEMYILYRNPMCGTQFTSHHFELIASDRSFQIFRVTR